MSQTTKIFYDEDDCEVFSHEDVDDIEEEFERLEEIEREIQNEKRELELQKEELEYELDFESYVDDKYEYWGLYYQESVE